MLDKINTISIGDIFFIRWTNYQVIFRYLGMPPDVHFTLAFNEDSADINLHLSRNLPVIEKPSIEIARINKQLLKDLAPKLASNARHAFWKPAKLQSYQLYSRKSFFLQSEQLEEPPFQSLFERTLTPRFKNISRLKGRRKLKVEGDIIDPFICLCNSPVFNKMIIDRLRRVPRRFSGNVMSGYTLFIKRNPFHCSGSVINGSLKKTLKT